MEQRRTKIRLSGGWKGAIVLTISALMHLALLALIVTDQRTQHQSAEPLAEVWLSQKRSSEKPTRTAPANKTQPIESVLSRPKQNIEPPAKPLIAKKSNVSHRPKSVRRRKRRLAVRKPVQKPAARSSLPRKAPNGVKITTPKPVAPPSKQPGQPFNPALVNKSSSTAPPNKQPGQPLVKKSSPMAPPKTVRPRSIDLRPYFGRLNRLVQKQKRYPYAAERMGNEGRVVVLVNIGRRGRLIGLPRVRRTSGYQLLDREALRMIRAAAPFPPVPDQVDRQALSFQITVNFVL